MRKLLWPGLAVLILIQFIPVQQDNPAHDRSKSFEVSARPTPELAALMQRSCKDCHSNETVWPWYSRIAPGSWVMVRDVEQGRKKFNLSQWGQMDEEEAENRIGEVCDEVKRGTMPPKPYLLLHPGARLSAQDVSKICSFSVVAPVAPDPSN
jgi:hypothetical protein